MTIKHKITFPPEVRHRAAMFRIGRPRTRELDALAALDALGINLGQHSFQPGSFLDILAAAVAEHAIIEPVPPTPITRDQIVEGMAVVTTTRDGWTRTAQADHQDADGDWFAAGDAGGWRVTSYGWTCATYDELPASPAERMAAALGIEPGAIRQALTDAGLDLSEWKP